MSKLYHFRQHIPGFVDGVNSAEFDFDTLEELLASAVVKRWLEDPLFHRYSYAERGTETLLMAETDEGFSWWVVGYITGVGRLDLPKWEAKTRLPVQRAYTSDKVYSKTSDT